MIPHSLSLALSGVLTFQWFSAVVGAETNVPLSRPADSSVAWGSESKGFRAGVLCWTNSGGDAVVSVLVSTTNKNVAWHYLKPPGNKFSRFELVDADSRTVLPTRKRVSGQLPHKIPVDELPRVPDRGSVLRGSGGGLRDWLIVAPGAPAPIEDVVIRQVYRIPREADYTLTICLVLYELAPDKRNVSRMDLPCVTARLHLAPGNTK